MFPASRDPMLLQPTRERRQTSNSHRSILLLPVNLLVPVALPAENGRRETRAGLKKRRDPAATCGARTDAPLYSGAGGRALR